MLGLNSLNIPASDFRSCQIRNFSTSNFYAKEKDGKAPEEVGIIKKFKKMMKDYWYVLIPVHVATSIVWFGGFYIMLKSVLILQGCWNMLELLRGFLSI